MAGKESLTTRTLVPHRRCSSANEQQSDRLAEKTARLSVTGETRHESVPTRGQPAADSAAPQQESGAADATDSE